jgi:outer membrane protein TolC
MNIAALPLLAAVLLASLPLAAEPIDFRQAIDLALKHSGVILSAQAERTRTFQHYRAEHDAYYPTVTFGSGIGYSFGQPIAVAGQAPSIFNVTHDQTIWNPATSASIKAAHSDYLAARIDYQDHTEQVILDTSLLYIQLDSTTKRLLAAEQQKQATDRALYIAQQREKAGVGSVLDTKHAELDSARVDLRITELQVSEDNLRERLARSIGRPAETLETVSDSIPTLPAPQPDAADDDVASSALANSDAIRAADERVRAAQLRARAQHKMKYPSIDFAGQYALLSNALNKYQDVFLYKHFSSSNYSFGFNFRIPVFNYAQSAEAAAADAQARKAEADAQTLRDQVANNAVEADHRVLQLQAQARVSRLEYEVAQANIDAVKLQIEQGHASVRDEEMARADVANEQVLLLESQFNYLRAQLQLLRQTGGLDQWALSK